MKRIGVLLTAVLIAGGLSACEDEHKDEHCVEYETHSHVHTSGTGKNKRTYTTRDRDCVRWEKNK